MAARRRSLSLTVLPPDVAVKIVGHLATASVRPMDQLRALRVICRFMRLVCSNPEVGRRISIERLSDDDDPINYLTLLHRLAQVCNPEACFIIGMHDVFRGPLITPLPILNENLEHGAAGGHKVAAYVAAILLYLANGGTGVDDTAKQYMGQAMAMEESVLVAPAGVVSTMLMFRDCFICRRVAANVIWRGRWRWPLKRVAPAPIRAAPPCAVEYCGADPQWGRSYTLFCSEDCWIHGQMKLFLELVLE
ncbi:hypothetical protein C2845_PM03G32580 [Panicum miliaceum]|uniref:F-box domain-containing protein n=1 Tax=Panicum miliaceum TaxID=4540 RepID=A0A3L6TGV7_PANMI|nr:hypothetical protein C2845_PM03G32580 [Panicum miliaceum]